MDDFERLRGRLDLDQPRWFYEWATGDELRIFADEVHHNILETAQSRLRNRVLTRLWPVLNSAMSAGIVGYRAIAQ